MAYYFSFLNLLGAVGGKIVKILKKKYNVSIYKKDGRENLLNLLEVYCRLNVTFILSVCKWFE